jgi:DNA-binding transcriptional MocR family regulator
VDQVTLLSSIEQRMTSPTARGLATAVSAVIAEKRLVAGDKLPPIRLVATELGLSPTTVSSAWAMLQRGGVIATGGRGGTRVMARHVLPSRYRTALTAGAGSPAGTVSDAGVSGAGASAAEQPRTAPGARRPPFETDLSTGTPDSSLLPSLETVLRRIRPPDEPRGYLDEPVLPELADVLAATWPYPAERITVVDGAMDALELIIATHVRFGDTVAVEDPCFPPLLDLLDAVGAHPVPVTLDEQGPRPDELRRAVELGAGAFFLQPRGQNPTGITTSAERLRAIAEIARAAGVLVIEDDSLGAIASSPDVSVGALVPELTMHVRSYSKSHGPDLRLAALGGPAALVQPVIDRRFLGQGWTSRLLQRVLVHLRTEPQPIAAVAAARKEYARRRDGLVRQLADRGVPVGGHEGLNIWVPVADETAALLHLAAHSIGASAGRPFAIGEGGPAHIRITAGLVRDDVDHIADVIAGAAGAVRHVGTR